MKILKICSVVVGFVCLAWVSSGCSVAANGALSAAPLAMDAGAKACVLERCVQVGSSAE